MKVSFQNISKQYKGKYALKNFTTELSEGVYGLLGANGAGKTTLINIFVGILGSYNGSVLIDGQDAKKNGQRLFIKNRIYATIPYLLSGFYGNGFPVIYVCIKRNPC